MDDPMMHIKAEPLMLQLMLCASYKLSDNLKRCSVQGQKCDIFTSFNFKHAWSSIDSIKGNTDATERWTNYSALKTTCLFLLGSKQF